MKGFDNNVTGSYELLIQRFTPMLNITSLEVNSPFAIIYPGNNFRIIAKIQNTGIALARNIRVQYYLTRNNQMTKADKPIHIDMIPNLIARAVRNKNFRTQISKPGTYYYWVCVGIIREIADTCLSKQMTIDPVPDLVTSVTLTPNIIYLDPDATTDFQLTANIHNQGGISTPTTYRYYQFANKIIATNSLIHRNDIDRLTNSIKRNKRNYRLGAIASGEYFNINMNIDIHSLGIYYHGICVNPVRDEVKINNNCESQRIEVKRKTDLKLKDFAASNTFAAIGDEVILSAIVGNDAQSSNRATTNVILRYYSSNDDTIGNEDDLEIAMSEIATLAADATADSSAIITLNSGAYYGVCVESGDDNPADNCSSAIFIGPLGSLWKDATNDAGWSARESHTSLVFANKMWVLGGLGRNNKKDVWFSTDGKNWQQATADVDWLSRYGHTSFVYNNKMWVLGGTNVSSYANDVWFSTDGANWQQATASADWGGRSHHTSLVLITKYGC